VGSSGEILLCGRLETERGHGSPSQGRRRGPSASKGWASEQLVNSERRQRTVLYRRARGTAWEELDLATAMEMVADRVAETRARTWQDTDAQGRFLRRTMGFASLGGATLDNEENYLIKKLFTALGAVQIENQARI
jgi:formate dehydrogenase major subunit